MLVSLPLAGLVIWHVHDTSYQDEKTIFVEDMQAEKNEEGSEGVEEAKRGEKVTPPDYA